MHENEISKEIVDAAYKTHTTLGPGLLESVYQVTMGYELEKRGLSVVHKLPIQIVYDGIHFDKGFEADLVVENKVIVELKSVADLAPVYEKQLLTHLRLSGMRLGLLINFNVVLIKDGIVRIVNNLNEANLNL
jgi:GxxExxY protein